MSNLIDFVFENIGFVIVLIGIAASLMGGDSKKKDQKKFPETTQMPTSFEKAKPVIKKVVTESRKAAETVTPKQAQKTILTQVEQDYKSSMDRLAQQQVKLERQARQIKQDSLLPAKRHGELPTYSNNKVVNGIIMAEVLGAPRSKKPFSGRR